MSVSLVFFPTNSTALAFQTPIYFLNTVRQPQSIWPLPSKLLLGNCLQVTNWGNHRTHLSSSPSLRSQNPVLLFNVWKQCFQIFFLVFLFKVLSLVSVTSSLLKWTPRISFEQNIQCQNVSLNFSDMLMLYISPSVSGLFILLQVSTFRFIYLSPMPYQLNYFIYF